MAKISLGDKGFKNILAEGEKLKQASEIRSIAISQLVPNGEQPRTHFDDKQIEELAESIKIQGVLQPILVREAIKDEKYEIIAGERRYRASRLLGLETIPAILKSATEEEIIAITLIENIQRENLTPLEEAQGYKTLLSKCDLTHEQIARRVGRSRSSITNTLRLLELGSYAKEYLEAGYFDMGHARALLGLNDEQQLEVVNKIIDGKLNVRQTEQLVQRIKNPTTNAPTLLPPAERELLEVWRQRLLPYTSQVRVKMDTKDKIKLTIECTSTDEAEMLINEIERVKSAT